MARRTLIGVVTSAKRDKTITVTVTSRETHPLYGKQYTVTRKYTAHDETNEAGEGDTLCSFAPLPLYTGNPAPVSFTPSSKSIISYFLANSQ